MSVLPSDKAPAEVVVALPPTVCVPETYEFVEVAFAKVVLPVTVSVLPKESAPADVVVALPPTVKAPET